MNIEFDVIVSSPLKRSLQTAAFIATETMYKSRVRESDSLAPEATLKDFKKLLNDYRDRDSILVVGHNPNLSVFLGALLVPAGASPAQIRLRKGSLAKLSFNAKHDYSAVRARTSFSPHPLRYLSEGSHTQSSPVGLREGIVRLRES